MKLDVCLVMCRMSRVRNRIRESKNKGDKRVQCREAKSEIKLPVRATGQRGNETKHC